MYSVRPVPRFDSSRDNFTRCASPPLNFVADSDYGREVDLDDLHVAGYGYRWIRLNRTTGG